MEADVKFAREAIARWWDEKPHRKLDVKAWMELENVQRCILRSAKDKDIDAFDALLLMDEALGAFTRRGTHLQEWDEPKTA